MSCHKEILYFVREFCLKRLNKSNNNADTWVTVCCSSWYPEMLCA